MKHLLFAAALAAATAPSFGADVGVSISIGQPGFYGRIDIGDFPAPQVIYRRPIAIKRVPANRAPIYLRVPPGHAKNWRRHCREYDACAERVLFVRDDWYTREYVPRYRERQRDRGDNRRDERWDDQHGNQNERGRGR